VPILALPDKLSIAVLPFANLSGDPEQEYFVDGIVEEIITALSRIRWLFVIARNSSFTYRGQAIGVKQVGRELGVRYVLEGSVRKGGGRVRITAQLIDAETGTHLWADRFDGSLEDVFELQDKVASSVSGVWGHLRNGLGRAQACLWPRQSAVRPRARSASTMACRSKLPLSLGRSDRDGYLLAEAIDHPTVARDDVVVLPHIDIGRCELPTILPEQAVDFDVLKFSRLRKLARESVQSLTKPRRRPLAGKVVLGHDRPAKTATTNGRSESNRWCIAAAAAQALMMSEYPLL
jgi:TolB-like protein